MLDLEIQALLRSPQVQEINFRMGRIRVIARGFENPKTDSQSKSRKVSLE